MEYIYICPKCGGIYGLTRKARKTCADCGVVTVDSGFTDAEWFAQTKEARKEYTQQIIAAGIPTNEEDTASVFCRYCGGKISQESEACPYCGRAVAETAFVFCSHCGEKINRESVVCPHCGCAIDRPSENDVPSGGLNALAFFFPLIGFILYLCMVSAKLPKRANAIGKWTLIGFCLGVVLVIFFGLF